jgi:hypothetical protein
MVEVAHGKREVGGGRDEFIGGEEEGKFVDGEWTHHRQHGDEGHCCVFSRLGIVYLFQLQFLLYTFFRLTQMLKTEFLVVH